MGDEVRLQEFIIYARDHLASRVDANGDFERSFSYLDMAQVFAAEGNANETIAIIRRWETVVADDGAEQ